MEVSQFGILCKQLQWILRFQPETKAAVVFRVESQHEYGFPVRTDVRAAGQLLAVLRTTDQVPKQRVCLRERGCEVGEVEFKYRGLRG